MIEITGEHQVFPSGKTVGEIVAENMMKEEKTTTPTVVHTTKKSEDPPPFRPDTEQLTAVIDWFPYAKIMHWIDKAKDMEVSGWGKVVIEGTTMRVVDAFLVKQRNSMAETDIDAADLAKVMYQTKDQPGTMNFWWHSHHSMNAYFSATDYANIKSHGQNGWLLSTVFNNREESQTSLYVAKPVQIFLDKLPLFIARPAITKESQAILDQQYREKVTLAWSGPAVITSRHAGYSGYNFTPEERDPNMPPHGSSQEVWDAYFEEKYPRFYDRGKELNSDDAPLRKPTKRERKMLKRAAKSGKVLTWDPASNSMVLK
jgi:hypothetical protein